MDGGTLVTRRPGLMEAEVDGELVALSIDRGECYGFNATATELWRLLDVPRTLDALCQALVAAFAVDRVTCAADVAAVLDQLAGQGLVTLTRAA